MTKSNITIVKVGGAILEEEASLKSLLGRFAALSEHKLLVHGGGRLATKLASKMGVETKMIDGRRITDSDMLNIVTMVYGGLINKKVVAHLQSEGINALGLTGADLNSILSTRRTPHPIDFGWVGDVVKANGEMLYNLVKMGIVPVIAPLTHDGKGNMLNTNADSIAATVAAALAQFFNVKLIFCFEKDGVLADENDNNSVIKEITTETYTSLKANNIVHSGMIPKLDNAFKTLKSGVNEVIITNANNLNNPDKGTHIIL